MAKAIGFGGAFIRARDPKALYAWYEQHLGLKSQGCLIFPAKEQQADMVVSFFRQDDAYFPTQQPAMLNFQVDDLNALLDALIAAGVSVDPSTMTPNTAASAGSLTLKKTVSSNGSHGLPDACEKFVR